MQTGQTKDDLGPLSSPGTLRPSRPTPTNLPTELTSFIGRRDELATTKKLLGQTRLLTLAGSGGCGKTRLALQLATSQLDGYPDGVWWTDLGPLSEPELVANAVARAARLQEVPSHSFAERITINLRDKTSLLVLDNCEHLVDECAEVVDSLLRECPSVKVVATSREPLGVSGETAWRVPSLPFPDESFFLQPESLSRYDAVRLFVERAVNARPNFRLTSENGAAVAEICRRLDGIPLAIELAAARTRLLSAEEIARGLTDRFRLLAGGARTTVPRQQTLLASVEWSYKLLGDQEKTLLRRLAVFAGSFTLDGAEAVCSDDVIPVREILDVVAGLVDKSLVQMEQRWTPTRYRMLETIRQYANEKLVDSDEAPAIRDRHLRFYVDVAEAARLELEDGSDLLGSLELLDLENDNLRAALEWARSVDREQGMRIARGLMGYWYSRGYWSEGSARCEAAAAATTAAPRWRVRALAAGAILATTAIDTIRAQALGEEAALVARSTDDDVALVEGLYAQGTAHFLTEPDKARAPLEEAIALARRINSRFWHRRAAYVLGLIEHTAGNFPAGRRLIEESLQMHRSSNNRFMIYLVLYWIAENALRQGDLDEAEAFAEEALAAAQEVHNSQIACATLCVIAEIAILRGDYEAAASAKRSERLIQSKHPHPLTRAMEPVYSELLNYVRGGDLRNAPDSLETALSFFEPAGVKWLSAWILALYADIERVLGNVGKAERLAERALDAARGCRNPWSVGCAGRAAAGVARARGNVETTEDLYHEAIRASHQAGAKPDVVVALEGVAGVASEQESWEEAVRLFGAADHLREVLGYKRFIPDARQVEQDIARARENLEPSDFERAWGEGATMSLDEAIAYAARGRGERKRPSSGWKSLTPVEADVVRLVAEGLTNAEIGKRLFISRGTVKNHLSHVFAKLGISTRSQLAAGAARRQSPSQ